MDPKSEIECLAAIAARQDEAAFASLFARYAPRIKGYMIRHGADASTAEELAQEAMTAVWRKAGMYSPDKGNPATWIFYDRAQSADRPGTARARLPAAAGVASGRGVG